MGVLYDIFQCEIYFILFSCFPNKLLYIVMLCEAALIVLTRFGAIKISIFVYFICLFMLHVW